MDEITAEYTTEQLLPPVTLRCTAKVSIASKTDLGRVREHNEDKYEFYLPEDEAQLATKGLIFLVCDGMGGHAAGQIASELACKSFIDAYLNHPSQDPTVAAEAAVRSANAFIFDLASALPNRKGMGTTLSGLMLVQDQAIVAQVGDSRVYRLREGQFECLTTDHTWVHEAVVRGEITEAMAETHPYRHVLTRAMGTEKSVTPDIFRFDLRVGDEFLLCSDGVMNHVSDEELGDLLRSHSPSQAAWKIVGAALQGGGSDNTTVLIVRVDGLG